MQLGHTIYIHRTAEAVPFYCRVFGLELGYHVKNADGSFFHGELTRDGRPLLALSEARPETQTHNNIVCLGMGLDSAEAVHEAVPLLAEDGSVPMPITSLPWSPCCAEVIDRYGVWWYLTAPQHSPGEDFDPEGVDSGAR